MTRHASPPRSLSPLPPLPPRPFRPAPTGLGATVHASRPRRYCLGGECELVAMKLAREEKSDPDARRVLERVIVPRTLVVQHHHWGSVRPRPAGPEGAVCLARDRFRVRVEGWAGDEVLPAEGWETVGPDECRGSIVIAVWSDRVPEETLWGRQPAQSGRERSYWIEYAGPRTRGIRRAGPFACTGDPVDHAMDDAGFRRPGVDGGYVLYDLEGSEVESAL